ncbi:MAG: TRAP transporter small permease [Clostridia bacterium]
MNEKSKKLMNALNNFEEYAGTILFMFLTVLCTVQVISRYVFNSSIVWTEELANIVYIWLAYLGMAAATLKRKHIRIDAILSVVPFKVKRVMLIVSNVVVFGFCAYINIPLIKVIQTMMKTHTKSVILGISKPFTYAIIPICMVLICIRLVQDTIALLKENEKTLGASEATIDFGDEESEEKLQTEAKETIMKVLDPLNAANAETVPPPQADAPAKEDKK